MSDAIEAQSLELLREIRDSLAMQAAELLDIRAVAVLCGVSPNTIYELDRNDPSFPSAVQVYGDAKRWRRAAILKWIESRPARKVRSRARRSG